MINPPLPEPVYTTYDDGTVEIRVGDLTGVVSSDHLKAPKTHQLQQAWLRAHHTPSPER